MDDTEYISKDSVLACFSDWIDRYGHEHTADEMVEYQRIEELPAADVVEVVRCKDCIHAPLPGDCEGGSNMEWPKIDGIYEDCTCPYFCDDDWYSTRPDPDGFCEMGERR